MAEPYPRDLVGYGANPPDPEWPGGARLAVSFVINYEEGGENCILDGNATSESYLQEIVGLQPVVGGRELSVESMYEYGSRVGFWRLHRMFLARDLPVTVYAVGRALERNPAAGIAMDEAGWEVASHGYRWINYRGIDEETERQHIRLAIEATERIVGTRPVGWYCGRCSPNTRRLVAEAGGFLYDSDSYADDVPYWETVIGKPHLVIPYTLDNNDMKFVVNNGFAGPDEFYQYLTDAFDVLYAEGADRPKMMSIGLHCRLAGRPGRAKALMRFLDHVQRHEKVWVCRRVDIARHWRTVHPYPGDPGL